MLWSSSVESVAWPPRFSFILTAGKSSSSTRASHLGGGGLLGSGSWVYKGCWCSALPSLDPCKFHFQIPCILPALSLSPNRVGAGKQNQEEMRKLRTWRVKETSAQDIISLDPSWVLLFGFNEESELLPHSFEYFFNDGTFVLSVVTSKFWKQRSPFSSNKAGPIATLDSGFHFTRWCNNALFHLIFRTTLPVDTFILQLQKKKASLRNLRNGVKSQNRGWTWIQIRFQTIAFYSTSEVLFLFETYEVVQ